MHQQALQALMMQPKPPEPPKISVNYGFKGPDLVDPQVRAEFDKLAQLPPPQGPPDNGNGNGNGIAKPPASNSTPIQGNQDVNTVQ